METGKGVTFNFNKYGKPEMLDLRESIAQSIVNALFMVPGNLPSLPHIGVNIRQYLYRADTEYVSAEIEGSLKAACGSIIHGVVINSVDFSVHKAPDGQSVFLIMIRLVFPSTSSESVLGVTVAHKKEMVKFNFAYADNV